MANMGYCRFQNTLQDLRDCREHITDNGLDSDERKARERLVECCRRIIKDYEDAGMDDDDEDDEGD